MSTLPETSLRLRLKRAFLFLAITAGALAVLFLGYHGVTRINPNRNHHVGNQIDSLNGVAVYFNGGVNNVVGRNLSIDGYNLGLRYQCVEFIKRYYYERFGHKMPDAYGHARDFFDPDIPDGGVSPRRNLVQFTNGGASNLPPQADDIIVFSPTLLNPYGHVAIVATVTSDSIEIVQQNPGPFSPSREVLPLTALKCSGASYVSHERVLGWLRRAPPGYEPSQGRSGSPPQRSSCSG